MLNASLSGSLLYECFLEMAIGDMAVAYSPLLAGLLTMLLAGRAQLVASRHPTHFFSSRSLILSKKERSAETVQ